MGLIMKLFLVSLKTGEIGDPIPDTSSEFSLEYSEEILSAYTPVIGLDTAVASQIKVKFDPLTQSYYPLGKYNAMYPQSAQAELPTQVL